MKVDTNAAVLDSPATSTPIEPTLQVTRAAWADMEAVMEIIRSSASWYEDIVEPEDFSEHMVDRSWARENFERRDFYVARLEDEVIGTISLQDAGPDHVYLGYVYLHESHVGNGFGRELLDFAAREAERRGRKAMVLIAHPEATWAHRAYRKYGFEVVLREREDVLAWADGWLEPYYEEGFELYEYRL